MGNIVNYPIQTVERFNRRHVLIIHLNMSSVRSHCLTQMNTNAYITIMNETALKRFLKVRLYACHLCILVCLRSSVGITTGESMYLPYSYSFSSAFAISFAVGTQPAHSMPFYLLLNLSAHSMLSPYHPSLSLCIKLSVSLYLYISVSSLWVCPECTNCDS